MKPDEPLCLCFHVTRRKVESFLRVERVRTPSQLAECGGAGTGCGWCRPYLTRMWEASRKGGEAELPAAERYAAGRGEYVRGRGGTPPPGEAPSA